MSTTMPTTVSPRSPIRAKHFVWVAFTLMTLLVFGLRERTLLDPHSFLRQRYSAIPLLMWAHGLPGLIALLLGFFQFSSRLRRRHLQLHRVLGRVYVGCAVISAPLSILVALALPTPTLLPATIIQAVGWLVTTGTGLYCIRTGRIQQHRAWMIRSYPFAMVFVVARALMMVPAIDRMGLLGVQMSVWSSIATACFLPSFILAWQEVASSPRSRKALSAA